MIILHTWIRNMFSKETSVLVLVLFVDMAFAECSIGCQSCSGSTCTSCESSYFLTNGFCSPCSENCESCSNYDDCTLCKPNKYGLHVRCAFNCDGNCLNSECQDDTGYCTQCEHGFYGYSCQHNCSFCASERCDLRTCSSGCRDGYFEYKTSVETICQTCPPDCKHCTNGKTCFSCNDGFYLYKFNDNVHCLSCFQENQCPDCVIQGCKQCQIQNNSLVCADCPEGQIFNGQSCGSLTSLCLKECSTYCDDGTGICQGECNEGWTGEKCSEPCNSKCLKCSKDNRNSCLLCKGNFYSTDCSLVCDPACIVKSGCQTCEHAGGYCLNGCYQTYWGDTCDKLCPDGCKNHICDRNNGTCTDGCKDGLTGDKCTQTITIETSVTATTTTSAEPVTQQQSCARCEDKVNNFVIIYFSGFGSCVAIEVFAVLLYLIRRRYLASKTPKDNKQNIENQTYYNTRTDFGAVNAESADASNNYESLSNNRTTDNVYNDLGTTLSST